MLSFRSVRSSLLFVCLLSAAACAREPETAASPVPLPATATTVPATATALPPPTAVTAPPESNETGAGTGEEAILILQPGPGSRIVNSPLHVTGVADPAFEQNLVARLLLDDGAELAVVPTIIQADVGQRGPFAVAIPFTVDGERQAFVQLYTTSARDGGITHLASVGLTLADAGAEQIVPVEPHPERIQISQPVPGQAVSGGAVTVAGAALASFEQTLLVELLDETGQPLDSQPVIVDAPDLGQPGTFSVVLAYQPASAGPGRVVVRDVSPAFGGDVHLASVEVVLAP